MATRLPSLSAADWGEFDAIWARLVTGRAEGDKATEGGNATEGELREGEAVRVDLAGAFRRDPSSPEEDVNWAQVEEAQMRARLDSLPDGYWASLRGSGLAATLYFDILRLEV